MCRRTLTEFCRLVISSVSMNDLGTSHDLILWASSPILREARPDSGLGTLHNSPTSFQAQPRKQEPVPVLAVSHQFHPQPAEAWASAFRKWTNPEKATYLAILLVFLLKELRGAAPCGTVSGILRPARRSLGVGPGVKRTNSQLD